MSKPPSVLICGSIRDGGALAGELQTYFRWRSEGLIDRLVFSGWLSDRADGNIDLMVRNGVEVVLSHQPVIRGPGHIFHQIKNFHFGLQAFADDEIVLRCRTDKTAPIYAIDGLTRRFHDAPPPGAAAPFGKRLMLQAALPLQPFFFNDMAFMGLAGDLRRLVSFDIWWEIEHAVLNPEQIFHLPPYRHSAPATHVFGRVNPGLEHRDPALSVEIYRFLLTQDLYLRAVAEGLAALEAGYWFGWDRDRPADMPEAASIAGLLDLPLQSSGSTLWMQANSNMPGLNHSEAVTALLDMPISEADARTPRSFLSLDAGVPEAELGRLARNLIEGFAQRFPGRHNAPVFPHDEGGLRVIPPRVQSVAAG
ncbi:hypothetical protein ACO2Q1_02980 [Brevundimonas sp. VNH65]|uniref:hypothetical protein n=1 Tax=Brevundimonas sp. VNH65 TaxID=3400917 RepID=UPI003BFA9C8F